MYTKNNISNNLCKMEIKNYHTICRHKRKNIYCVNCGEKGHIVKECHAPITSYGIIAFKVNDSYDDEMNDKNDNLKLILNNECIVDTDDKYPKIKFLMIQRKDTIGYIDFIRGKYNDLTTCLNEMTKKEKINILSKSFDELWDELWVCNKTNENYYKQEYNHAKRKFNLINSDLLINTLEQSQYTFQEFGFPKGRREIKEKNIECAEREFFEETGYDKSNYEYIKNYPIIEEIFKGSNGITYKHVYFLVKMKDAKLKIPPVIDTRNIIQMSEVQNVGWFSYNECQSLIRPYDEEKKKTLTKVYHDIIYMENKFACCDNYYN